MRYTSMVCGLMTLTTFATALPFSSASFKRGTPKTEGIAVYEHTDARTVSDKREDGDDQVVYTWAVPESESKDKREDGDEKVVYPWDVPEIKRKEKREDGDDQVVYTWAVPDEVN
ncbi:hypothetical protein PISL3812_06217 [Talaromyces islandicus]|uniref:Uncharacterized protein n=1 Tax=Talaromyces islandicus TaxID=28573 RepID=A0A0U1M2I3_TALIS|nr:hypothetical protein PISL3812_06217 [Talaromyces islandicus]